MEELAAYARFFPEHYGFRVNKNTIYWEDMAINGKGKYLFKYISTYLIEGNALPHISTLAINLVFL